MSSLRKISINQGSDRRLWTCRHSLYCHHKPHRSQILYDIFTHLHDVPSTRSRLFGIILFATEFKVDFVLQKVGFLRSLLGRAVFNIL